MRKLITIVLILAVAFAVAGIIGCKKAEEKKGEAKEITIVGSTTILPVMQKAVEIYLQKNPEMKITVSGGGSGVGITSLLDGSCDIAMASRPMKDEEKKQAEEKGLKLKEVEIGKDGITIVVHPSNTVPGLTKDQLKDIYTGKIKNWKEVGGPDLEIVVVSRDTNSGTFEEFNNKILNKEKVVDSALLQASNAAVRSAVAGAEGAIGYLGLGFVDSSVKSVKLDNIESTEETVRSLKYPLSRSLFLYIRQDAAKPVTDFIDFILSPDGQKLVKEEGYLSLK
jgi:phosphate transport system substrate-binding protein